MKDITKVSAGIVTFNPEINRLKENIKSVLKLVDLLIVFDNNSKNIKEIEAIKEEYDFILCKSDSNKGISYALNRIMEIAIDNDYSWCITLDQDSIVPHNLIDVASAYLKSKNVCMIVPQILEVNTGEIPNLDTEPDKNDYQVVKKCITSSSITNTRIWSLVGGFDEDMFIDYVDFDYAAKCRKNGYRIIRMNKVFLKHELGESVMKSVLGVKLRVANHSAFRKYYISRNIVIYIKKYRKDKNLINPCFEVLRLIKQTVLIILFENNKTKKLKASFKGIYDGLKTKV